MSAGYTADTEGAVALSAATAKTIMALTAVANEPIRLVEWSVSFDGVSASAVPVLVELVRVDLTTAGTSTSSTVKQIRGATRTARATSTKNYTAEPTTVVAIKPILVTPNGGFIVVQYPLGREPESSVAGSTEAIGIRCTAPATVNVRGYMEWEEG